MLSKSARKFELLKLSDICRVYLFRKEQYKYLKIQQVPNPWAQLPSVLPPLFVHSDSVKQVPVSPELLPVQSLWENKEKYFLASNQQETDFNWKKDTYLLIGENDQTEKRELSWKKEGK